MKNLKQAKRQQGSYLIGVGIGILIVLLLSAWGIPKFNAYLVEGAIPSVSEEIQRFVSRVKVSSNGGGVAPYTGLTQDYFARSVKGSSLSVGDIAGQGTAAVDVRHGLGGGDTGLVTLTSTGPTFSLTFTNVSDAACPGLAANLQRSFDVITINKTAVKTTDASNVVTQGYVSGTAAAKCLDGDKNIFVFTVNRS
ncbi:type 4 pilus major pilin [Pseudomonas helleri]|uniref:type 4 pilus major pilin n=1 Tax=Pseudomonas helleri TaxID=1608996 RepID=UPI003FD1E528